MKARDLIFVLLILCPFYPVVGQGDTYSNPIPLTLDGVERDYAVSSSTGDNLMCTPGTISPITWFSFTTNSVASCPLLAITITDSLPCEIALYNSINGNINNNIESTSGMCFDDGFGLWAPAESLVLGTNKTYYLRIKTASVARIRIAGQHTEPANDDCTGALSIGTTAIDDNNACHQPGPGVSPDQLCAFTLENTAFYQFYVASNGSSIINISNITCDNIGSNNSNGFQIGFFTGDCISLNPISCTSGSGDFVQATSPPLTAGTKVYVAIDGNGGSNCSYSLTGINVTTVLQQGISHFSVWETPRSNRITWETGRHFDGHLVYIERSADGRVFEEIGQVNPGPSTGEERTFQFEDLSPLPLAFYRLLVISGNNRREYSPVKELRRKDGAALQLNFQNPVSHFIEGMLYSGSGGRAELAVIDGAGRRLMQSAMFISPGQTSISRDLSSLPSGKYFIQVRLGGQQITKGFILLK